MNAVKFYIDEKGDPSVGIFPYIHTVTIETNILASEFDKSLLAEMFDVSEKYVYTEAEWKAMEAAEAAMEKEDDN